jgi:hypothetical protein
MVARAAEIEQMSVSSRTRVAGTRCLTSDGNDRRLSMVIDLGAAFYGIEQS